MNIPLRPTQRERHGTFPGRQVSVGLKQVLVPREGHILFLSSDFGSPRQSDE